MRIAISGETPWASSRLLSRLAAALLPLIAYSGFVNAATLCVQAGDAVGLQSALATAANNDEDDIVELQAGQYSLPQNFVLTYFPDNSHQHDLKIAGGYTEFFGGCLAPTAPNASATVVDGGIFHFRLPDGAGAIEFDSLTLSNMLSTNQYQTPFSIGSTFNSTGDVIIKNSVFDGNTSFTNNAVSFWVENGVLSVQNSLFSHNASLAGYQPISFLVSNSGQRNMCGNNKFDV